MPKRSSGLRVATRKKLSKHIRSHGKVRISSFLQSFSSGDKVQVIIEPAYHKGMPFRRFFGREGVIVGKQGSAYLVNIRDGGKYKKVLCTPVHLRKI